MTERLALRDDWHAGGILIGRGFDRSTSSVYDTERTRGQSEVLMQHMLLDSSCTSAGVRE
jgi:hypothetical protein